MARDQVDRNAEKTSRWAAAIVVALVMGVSLGFIDVLKNMIGGIWDFPTFWSVWSTLAVRIAGAVSLYIPLWLGVQFLRWVLKWDLGRLTLETAVFAGLLYELPLRESSLFTALIKAAFIALAGAVLSYGVVKLVALTPRTRKTGVHLFLALPLILAGLTLTIWLHQYHLSGFFSGTGLLVNVGLIIFIGVTAVIFAKARRVGVPVLVVGVFGAATFLSSAWAGGAGPMSFGRAETQAKSDRQIKHVILIVIDTLRADALSCYGGQRIDTPHIDQLAADGIVFEQAFSPSPWTLPSVASIMTGLSPSVHLATHRTSVVPKTLNTLAEYLEQAEYLTGAFGNNSFLSRGNLSQGFKEFYIFPKPHDASLASEFFERFTRGIYIKRPSSTRDITRWAQDWLEVNHQKDFFLWLHYFDPHLPYTPPEQYLPDKEPPNSIGLIFNRLSAVRSGHFFPTPPEREWTRTLYDGEVRYVDANVGIILERMKELNIYDDSLIVLTSDHGEEFWEHDGFEHGHTLYQELLKMPLIIKPPRSSAKKTVTETVSTEQIMPTILQLCRVDYDKENLSAGSLEALWSPQAGPYAARPIYSSFLLYYENRESVIFDRMKYIRFLVTGREELYDLQQDPDEQHNIIDSSPSQAQKARDILIDHKKTAQKLREHYYITEGQESQLDQRTLKQLQSLGYIDK